MRFRKPSVSATIESLKDVATTGLDGQPSQSKMRKTVEKAENQFPDSDSSELEYWLGIALRNYTAWFIRGDERKQYLVKAVEHFQKAYELEVSASGKNQLLYASELGALLVNEAAIRDLERGLPLLETAFQSTQDYEPLLCSYADGLYKTKNYQEAAAVAVTLHNRAKKSKEWKNAVPPAPMRIAAKAYRAQVRNLKKEKRLTEACAVSQQLLATGFATENDQRLHYELIDSAAPAADG